MIFQKVHLSYVFQSSSSVKLFYKIVIYKTLDVVGDGKDRIGDCRWLLFSVRLRFAAFRAARATDAAVGLEVMRGDVTP